MVSKTEKQQIKLPVLSRERFDPCLDGGFDPVLEPGLDPGRDPPGVKVDLLKRTFRILFKSAFTLL